jgi:hypothetical protein
MQANCSKWEKEGSQTEENREALSYRSTFTIQPKGILVIGHTGQLDQISKRNTFELFRRNTVNPEILTFDELYERAKFIVPSHSAIYVRYRGCESTAIGTLTERRKYLI